jgi:hypothetical protein
MAEYGGLQDRLNLPDFYLLRHISNFIDAHPERKTPSLVIKLSWMQWTARLSFKKEVRIHHPLSLECDATGSVRGSDPRC